jgi:hexokinase
MPGFRTAMVETFTELYGGLADRIVLALTHDGSGLGAAIIAASALHSPAGPA